MGTQANFIADRNRLLRQPNSSSVKSKVFLAHIYDIPTPLEDCTGNVTALDFATMYVDNGQEYYKVCKSMLFKSRITAYKYARVFTDNIEINE